MELTGLMDDADVKRRLSASWRLAETVLGMLSTLTIIHGVCI